jgi:hypothetical protein
MIEAFGLPDRTSGFPFSKNLTKVNAVFNEPSLPNSAAEVIAKEDATESETEAETSTGTRADRELRVGSSPFLHALSSALAQADRTKDIRPQSSRSHVCIVEIFIRLSDPWDWRLPRSVYFGGFPIQPEA